MNNEISLVDYGNHIGEYIKYKLRSMGIKQAFLAEALDVSKQNITYYLGKAEMFPSEINRLKKHLPEGFFNEFFDKNPDLDHLQTDPKESNDVQEKTLSPVEGLKLLIQIDPVDFNPEHADALGTSLKEALEAFQKRISTK